MTTINLAQYRQVKVKYVELTGKTESVWDVSLSECDNDALPHSIITNGVLTHNSGGSDPEYLESVLRTIGVKEKAETLFGVTDDKGKVVIRPKIRYRDSPEGEVFFQWLAAIQRRLPDKVLIGGKWWYVFEETKQNRAKYGSMIDTKMTRSSESGLYMPASDGELQMAVLLDSLPSLMTEDEDDDNPKNTIAQSARMFSRNLRRVKARLRSKRVLLLGINQLRKIPMAMYGPDETETGGEALKYYSDSRTRFKTRASGMPFNPVFDKGIQQENSVEYDGTKDAYRYLHVKNHKNKMGTPYRETWIRLWISDGAGNARGFDPAFDCLQYLVQTGQATFNRKAITLNLNGNEAKKTLSMGDFKFLVLGTKADQRDVYKSIGMKPVSLRPGIFEQLASRKAEKLLIVTQQSANKKKSAVADDDDDDD